MGTNWALSSSLLNEDDAGCYSLGLVMLGEGQCWQSSSYPLSFIQTCIFFFLSGISPWEG